MWVIVNPANSTPAEVFAFIEKEIKESIPDLSEKGDDRLVWSFYKISRLCIAGKTLSECKSNYGRRSLAGLY